jgi:pilus assembly protein FimV
MQGFQPRPRHPYPKWMVLATLAALSCSAQALSLGRLQMLSGTGQPLRAEVEITDYTPQELQNLNVRIAPPASFQSAGMEYNPALADVTGQVLQRSTGRPYIALAGQTPLRENFIDLILEAQSSTVRVAKNYALLLSQSPNAPVGQPMGAGNSPVFTPLPPATPTPVDAAPARPTDPAAVRAEVNARGVPVYRFDTPPTPPAPAVAPPRPAPAVQGVGGFTPRPPALDRPVDDNVEVLTGETLSQIALAHLPLNVTLDQMMVALQQANPGAFIEGNVNLVKAGAFLKIPKPQQVASIAPQDARRMVIEQTQAFLEYSRRIAQTPMQIDKNASARDVAGAITDPTAPAKTGAAGQDKLTLSKGSVASGAEEARVAMERETRDTGAQVAEVNRNLKDLQALARGEQPGSGPSSALPALTTPTATTAPQAAASDTAADPGQGSLLDRLANDRNTQIWAGALVLLIGLFAFWMVRRRDTEDEDDFAPEYDDRVETYSPPRAQDAGVPRQMADLDLNLGSATAERSDAVPSSAANATAETDVSKLNLASQLSARGEHELARALLQSVMSFGSPELRYRAKQMLDQMP